MAKKRWKHDFLLERLNADIAHRASTVYVDTFTIYTLKPHTCAYLLYVYQTRLVRDRSNSHPHAYLGLRPRKLRNASYYHRPCHDIVSSRFLLFPSASLPFPLHHPLFTFSLPFTSPFSSLFRFLSATLFRTLQRFGLLSPSVSSSLLGSVSFVSSHSSLFFHSSIFRLIRVASRSRPCSRSRTEYTRVITQSFLPFLPRKSIFIYFLMSLIVSRLRQRLYRVKEKQHVESRKKLRYHRPRHQHHRSISTISNTGNPLKPSVHLICVSRFADSSKIVR